jgi:Transposase, Mutator family
MRLRTRRLWRRIETSCGRLVQAVLQELLQVEMTEALGAEKGERTRARLGYRRGYYGRTLVSRVGKLELRVLQDRQDRSRDVPPGGRAVGRWLRCTQADLGPERDGAPHGP